MAATLFCSGRLAACEPPPLQPVESLDLSPAGDLRLKDGRLLRLAGLMWPSATEKPARARLMTLLEPWIAQGLLLVQPVGAVDRWGRIPAHVHAVDPHGPPIWLQGLALESGATAYWPEPEVRPCLAALKQFEGAAAREQLGVWSPLYRRAGRVRLSGAAPARLSPRVIFEGRVRSVREGRSIVFVNFHGKRAATPYLTLTKRSLDEFRTQGLDPATFSGKRLLVRAVLGGASANRLEIAGPQSIDVLE